MGKRRGRNDVGTVQPAVHIVSLGCPKNLVDTEIITGALLMADMPLAAEPEMADIFLINTCAFIPAAREEADEHIRDALRWKKSRRRQGIVVVCGCLTGWDGGSAMKKYPGVDLWFGIDDVAAAAEILKRAWRGGRMSPVSAADPCFLPDHHTPRLQLTPSHYAYVKIADGCDNHCHYCSIPSIRGALRCRPKDSIVREVCGLVENGVREIILIAQDTAAYASGEDDLASLLKAIDELDGDFWLRVMYAHPARLNDDIIAAMAESRHVIAYLDLPLQHISDRILKDMNRKIDGAGIKKRIRELRVAMPGIAIRTTFILGFPGETDGEFAELLDFVQENDFERLGAFIYQAEPGTPAAGMSNPVPAATAAERLDRLMRAQARISLTRNRGLVGTEIDVIVDSVDGGAALCRAMADAPDIDNQVLVDASDSATVRVGDFLRVAVVEADEYSLRAEITNQP